jgi:hypothetical protein
MCVAVIVSTKTGPTDEEIRLMDEDNPHGAGLAWYDHKRDTVRYKKGLDANGVIELLKKIPRPALLHFRWATHGSKTPELTHPFPLGPRALTDRRLSGTAEAVLIHNGVWNNYGNHVPEWAKGADFSDTMIAAYVADRYPEILDEVSWCTATLHRRALNKKGEEVSGQIWYRGNWSKHGGNLYSNLNWKRSQYRGATRRAVESVYDSFDDWWAAKQRGLDREADASAARLYAARMRRDTPKMGAPTPPTPMVSTTVNGKAQVRIPQLTPISTVEYGDLHYTRYQDGGVMVRNEASKASTYYPPSEAKRAQDWIDDLLAKRAKEAADAARQEELYQAALKAMDDTPDYYSYTVKAEDHETWQDDEQSFLTYGPDNAPVKTYA